MDQVNFKAKLKIHSGCYNRLNKFLVIWLHPIKWILAFFIALIYACLLVACHTSQQTLSLDEAKEIAVQFGNSQIDPPPRSVRDLHDIISVISSNQVIGSCLSEPKLSIEEIDKRLQNAPAWPSWGSKSIVLQDMAMKELNEGRYSRSIKLLKISLDALPVSKGARGNRYSTLAWLYANAGDFDSAKKALNIAGYNYGYYGSGAMMGTGWSAFHFNRATAITEMLKGNLDKSEKHYREAIDAYRKLGHGYKGYLTKTELAENLMLQGRLLEAENIIRELLIGNPDDYKSWPVRGQPDEKYLLVLSRILIEQGRFSEAEYVARAAVKKYISNGVDCSSIFLNLARQALASSLTAQERWKEAVAQFEAIKNDMQNDPEAFKLRFSGSTDWALTLLASGQPEKATEILNYGLKQTKNRLGKRDYQTAEIRGFLAITLTAEGRYEEALKEFNAAIPILLSGTQTAGEKILNESARYQRLKFIVEGYLKLLDEIKGSEIEKRSGINAFEDSLLIADYVRNISTQQAVKACNVRVYAKDDDLADLIRREQDIKRQISARIDAIVRVSSQVQFDRGIIEILQSNINRLREARNVITNEIEKQFPKYAQLTNTRLVEFKEVRESLLPNESLVSIYIGKTQSYIWAIPYRGPIFYALVQLSEKDVENMVAKIREAVEPNARTVGEIPKFDLNNAFKLFHKFLEPVKGGWINAKNLIIIPHGPLTGIPFSLLPTEKTELSFEEDVIFKNYQEVPWLIRTHSLRVFPSISTMVILRTMPKNRQTRLPFVGFGDPFFSQQQADATIKTKKKNQFVQTEKPDSYDLRGLKIKRIETNQLSSAELEILPRLPETAEEIRNMASAMNADLTRDVFTGVKANEHIVKTLDLSRYKVIAFATHGLAPGDLNGLLQPALALSSPIVAGINGDGLLKMEEILGLRLNADWVVLSACNTGAGIKEGSQSLTGLCRAFFYAGAKALLVSSWPVETTSAKAITIELFRRQAEKRMLSRAEALQQSMISLIDGAGRLDPSSGKEQFSYAHPIFWAPFIVVGD